MYIYENMIYSEMIYLIGQLNKVKEEAIEFSKCGRSPKTHITLTGESTIFTWIVSLFTLSSPRPHVRAKFRTSKRPPKLFTSRIDYFSHLFL